MSPVGGGPLGPVLASREEHDQGREHHRGPDDCKPESHQALKKGKQYPAEDQFFQEGRYGNGKDDQSVGCSRRTEQSLQREVLPIG